MVIIMKVVGLIVEYNPLHYGHIHHIEETKRLLQADVLIAVMSGNVVQRGEIAITDKFTRTKMALEAGLDLVVELPAVYTMQNADIFAKASVSILNHLGITDLCFGSENGEISSLQEMAGLLDSEDYHHALRDFLAKGDSFPTASNKAMESIHPNNNYDLPNNILGIQYIRAVNSINKTIQTHTIKRKATNYYDAFKDTSKIQSASAIRRAIEQNEAYKDYLPDYVFQLLKEGPIYHTKDFYPYLRYKLLSSSSDDLHQIYGMEEGLEHRMKKAAVHASTYEEFLAQVITRRYTNARLNRLFMHTLFGIKKQHLDLDNIPYVRILGMNKQGQKHLGIIKHDMNTNLLTNIKKEHASLLDIDLRISKLLSLNQKVNLFKRELSPPIILHID